MIQRHRILLNPFFSGASTVASASTLTNVNGYQVTNVQGLGGGITNPTNIRAFLADVNNVNDFIVNDFFSYMTGATTTVEFAEIYNSDQKLSDVFNNYYQSSIVNTVAPPISVIDASLSGTTGITILENQYFNVDGVAPSKGLMHIPLSIDGSSRKLRAYSALTTFNNEESYYIPVFIRRNAKQMARQEVHFDEFQRIIEESIPPVEDDNIGDDYAYGGGDYMSGGGYDDYGYGGGNQINTPPPPNFGEAEIDLDDSIFNQFL